MSVEYVRVRETPEDECSHPTDREKRRDLDHHNDELQITKITCTECGRLRFKLAGHTLQEITTDGGFKLECVECGETGHSFEAFHPHFDE